MTAGSFVAEPPQDDSNSPSGPQPVFPGLKNTLLPFRSAGDGTTHAKHRFANESGFPRAQALHAVVSGAVQTRSVAPVPAFARFDVDSGPWRSARSARSSTTSRASAAER